MPPIAAHSLLQSAQIEPYTRWTLPALRRVCRHLGVRLIDGTLPLALMDRHDLDGWDACLLDTPRGRVIVYHPGHVRTHRFVFSVAHEIGHHVMGHPPDPPRWMEHQANEFAAHLLMPCHEIHHYQKLGLQARQIARAKGVSVAAVEIRLKGAICRCAAS